MPRGELSLIKVLPWDNHLLKRLWLSNLKFVSTLLFSGIAPFAADEQGHLQ
jgi:hypothetical protein